MLDESPLVCICIPTFNVAVTVKETLDSIVAQTYQNTVIHISDNASTDGTVNVVKSVPDKRIQIHCNSENVGGEGNFTRCIELAEGKYTAIFHADDLYNPEMVSRQVDFLESNPNICAVFTAAHTIDENGTLLSEILAPPFCKKGDTAIYDFKNLLKTILLRRNFLVCPSAMVKTETYKNVIRQWGSSLFNSASDVDTWLRLASSAPIAVINEPLMRYRISQLQYSDKIRKRTSKTDFFLVMDHYLSIPEVVKILSKEDFRHYGWLLRHENVACASNLLANGESLEAKNLLKGLICWDSLNAAISTRLGFKTLAGGIFLKMMIFLSLSNKSYRFLNKLKNNERG
ncbi:glycosyltransferase [Polynucleobacter sp. MWH-UH35A]|uniref:glycosyltransferase family 2 protein n=1 Tax=Polynucleobacter sp. MWH-UH35A TaxID=1855619 RepID=UPI001BFD225F|nr:glycosyltransferase [Polynucleobacter sp. MWH-UH35A]